MNILESKLSEIETLKQWFPNKESCYFWSGPGLKYPFSHESFLEDIRWEQIPSYSLLDKDGTLIGFGQYYEKANRCHLARLAISPIMRSRKIGKPFISQLMNIGMKNLGTNECSLFVIKHNERALNCYQSLGFINVSYPPNHEKLHDIDFMIYRGL